MFVALRLLIKHFDMPFNGLIMIYKIFAYRIMKPLVRRLMDLFRLKINLSSGNPLKFVIIYGATTKVGKLVSKVVALKFGYSVVLVD